MAPMDKLRLESTESRGEIGFVSHRTTETGGNRSAGL